MFDRRPACWQPNGFDPIKDDTARKRSLAHARFAASAVAGLLLAVFAVFGHIMPARADTPTNAPDRAPYLYTGEIAFAPNRGWIDARLRVTVRDPALREATFLLSSSFPDVTVEGDVESVEITQQTIFGSTVNRITVALAPAQDQGRDILFSYAGVLFPEPREASINSITADKVELTVDSLWHPFDTRFSEQIDADLRLLIEGDWTGLAYGDVRTVRDGEWRLVQTGGIDIPLTFIRDYRRARAPGYTIYDTRETDDGLPLVIETAAACTNWLNARFGADNPLPPATIVVHDRKGSGYARQTLIALSDISTSTQQGLTKFVCHELAHYWSSNANANSVEHWMNESFAEYVAFMAVRDILGEAAFTDAMAHLEARLAEAGDTPPIWAPGRTERGPFIINYVKGPLALMRLEKSIGRGRFAKFVARYMTEGVATTPDLLDVLEAIAGAQARAAFVADLAR